MDFGIIQRDAGHITKLHVSLFKTLVPKRSIIVENNLTKTRNTEANKVLRKPIFIVIYFE